MENRSDLTTHLYIPILGGWGSNRILPERKKILLPMDPVISCTCQSTMELGRPIVGFTHASPNRIPQPKNDANRFSLISLHNIGKHLPCLHFYQLSGPCPHVRCCCFGAHWSILHNSAVDPLRKLSSHAQHSISEYMFSEAFSHAMNIVYIVMVRIVWNQCPVVRAITCSQLYNAASETNLLPRGTQRCSCAV